MVMAVTGQVLVLFIIVHAAGNSTFYFGGLNAYADKLHSLAALVWANRLVLLAVFSVHIFFGISLTLENRAAKPETYAVKQSLCATFASRNMIWTGLVTGAFLLYHLLHFTFQVTHPETAASVHMAASGRPDVSGMLIAGFQDVLVSAVYIASLGALLLHMSHGIQSSFQSLGLNSEHTMPLIQRAGNVLAYIIFIAFISIPFVIVIGLMKGK